LIPGIDILENAIELEIMFNILNIQEPGPGNLKVPGDT
jgi:hypothetical protein